MLLFLLSISDEKDHPKIMYIYSHYHDDMIRFAKARLKNIKCYDYNSEAEDTVQDAFIKIIKYIDSIDLSLEKRAVRAYLFSIICNVINDRMKDKKHFEDIDEYSEIIEDNDDFIEVLLVKEQYDTVLNAIEQLDEIYKITFACKYKKGMSAQEIADFMGVPLKTVQTRLLRGRHMLLDMLESDDCNG